jgi:hypothetical protein
MVRVRVRVRVWVAAKAVVAFRVWTVAVQIGKRQWAPERTGIGHTHARA